MKLVRDWFRLTLLRSWWFLKWSQALNAFHFCFPSLLIPLPCPPILHPHSSWFRNNRSRGEGTGNCLNKCTDQMSPHWGVEGRMMTPQRSPCLSARTVNVLPYMAKGRCDQVQAHGLGRLSWIMGEPNVTTWSLKTEEEGRREDESAVMWERLKLLCWSLGQTMEESSRSQGMWTASRNWKKLRNGISPRA